MVEFEFELSNGTRLWIEASGEVVRGDYFSSGPYVVNPSVAILGNIVPLNEIEVLMIEEAACERLVDQNLGEERYVS